MKYLIIKGIQAYKRFLSPYLPMACRFSPTCSVYALESFQKYPLGKAFILMVSRLSRCHPFHPGGVDPVP